MNAVTDILRPLKTPRQAENFHDSPLNDYGWTLVIGYNVLDYGCKAYTFVNKFGEYDHDGGSGAEVQLVSFELQTAGQRITVEREAFTQEQLADIEAEIVVEVEQQRDER